MTSTFQPELADQDGSVLAGAGSPSSPVIPLARPHLWGNEEDYLLEAVRSGWFSHGDFVRRFEEHFAARLGAKYGVATSSGTAAVHLALSALDIGLGDEVIVPAMAMGAPIFAVCYCGARPVPVDVDACWNLDPESIEQRIGPRTRAILVAHNYGHPAQMDRILAIAARHDLPVIEDAAEVLGASVGGRAAGSLGVIGCFSLYANKVIHSGEGGMLVTDDPALRDRLAHKRNMCFGTGTEERFTHQEIGFSYRMSNLAAAFGLAQLEHIDEALIERRAVGASYGRCLADISGISTPPLPPDTELVYWVYGVELDERFGVDRRTLQSELATRGIESRRFFTPVHLQPFLHHPDPPGSFPRAERLWHQALCLPCYVGLGEKEVGQVAHGIREIRTRALGRATESRSRRHGNPV